VLANGGKIIFVERGAVCEKVCIFAELNQETELWRLNWKR
jgi:hypothetical protein